MTDFLSLLRTKDIHSLQDVSLAQIEIGGNLTVLRKGEEAFSVLLIENGVINHENLRQIQKTESWLRRKLKEMKVNKAEEVFYAQWQKGKLYVIKIKAPVGALNLLFCRFQILFFLFGKIHTVNATVIFAVIIFL